MSEKNEACEKFVTEYKKLKDLEGLLFNDLISDAVFKSKVKCDECDAFRKKLDKLRLKRKNFGKYLVSPSELEELIGRKSYCEKHLNLKIE